jgi:phosphate starvation-inducible PhoH-like protein
VARAVEALEASDVRRIILVRPAVEAGEKLSCEQALIVISTS